MFLRFVLVFLALLSVAHCQPDAGAANVLKVLGRPVVPIEPNDEPKKRTLVMLLPALFPNAFYFS